MLSILKQALFSWFKPHQHGSGELPHHIIPHLDWVCCVLYVWSEKNEKQGNWLAKHHQESFILVAVAISSFILGDERDSLCPIRGVIHLPLKYCICCLFSRKEKGIKYKFKMDFSCWRICDVYIYFICGEDIVLFMHLLLPFLYKLHATFSLPIYVFDNIYNVIMLML